jgi:outer membrane protein
MRLPCVALAIVTLFGSPAFAQSAVDDGAPLDSFRMFWTKSSETDLVTGFAGDFDASKESNYLIGANWGRQFSDTLFGLPFPMTANVGVQYINERGYQPDIYGVTAFIKAHYDVRVPWTQKKIRLGLGEGLSYLSRVPMSEQRDFAKKGVESEKLLNYLEWTVDLPLRQFPAIDSLIQGRVEELNVGFIVFHRSSIFGLFAESKGGVNFMGFGIEARF